MRRPPTPVGPAMAVFSVLIVEEQARYRAAYELAVQRESDIRVLGSANELREGWKLFDRLKPDVLLLDLDLHGGAMELIRHANQRVPACEVMAVSLHGDDALVMAAIEAGATGFLLKGQVSQELPQQLRTLHEGGSPISPAVARRLLQYVGKRAGTPALPSRMDTVVCEPIILSDNEAKVLTLAAKGFTFDEIAKFLGVSPHTVTTYVKRAYRKLQVRSKVEAIYEARRLGWLRD